MAHFQKKIEEMQRKLNMINDNIEDIKSGKISYEEKKRANHYKDFLRNNIKKKNHLKMVNNSINFFNKKTEVNSDFNSIINNRNSHYKYKNSFSNNNLLDNNIPKNTFYENHKLNLNNEQKYINCPNEISKNETPRFLRNNSYYPINNLKEYQLDKNKNSKKKNMRKINSASEIINSISIIKGHKKFKKYLNEKMHKNKLNINNNDTNKKNNDIDEYSYNTENVPPNKSKIQHSKSIDNSRIKIKLNKGYFNCQKNNNANKHKRNSNIIDKNILNYNYNSIRSNRSYTHKIIKKENKNEQILYDIINLTNEYNKCLNRISKCKINKDNILHAYKLLLFNNKIKDEFIFKIMNIYNKNNKIKLDLNNFESFTPLLNWIKENNNSKQENDAYKNLCLGIMQKYNLENVEQLKMFIHKLLKKVNNNEYFLEGIKKILLP